MIPDVKRRLAEAYKNLQDAVVCMDTGLRVPCGRIVDGEETLT